MDFSIIVAKTLNNVIGYNNKIPWNLSKDLKYFYDITTEVDDINKVNVIIMGRKTWESLLKPLSKRIHIVLTNKPNYIIDDNIGFIANSFNNAFEIIQQSITNVDKIFVIGGEHIYKQSILLPNCKKIYCTELLHIYDIFDKELLSYFPEIPSDLYQLTKSSDFNFEKNICFKFLVYDKITIL